MDRVLVVEDSRAINSMLCARLEDLGDLQAESAASLAETEVLLTGDPGRFMFAVLDLNLPDAPNGEVVDLVRGFDIPVVVLTGSLDPALRRTMFDKQVLDYEIKRSGSGIGRIVDLVCRIRHFRHAAIMVVDDSASSRMFVAELLRRHCYQVIEAASGEQALALLDEHPDIAMVVTDYHMPGMDGAELTAEIRRRRDRDELAVIGLSSGSKGEVTIPLLKSGANDFLAKPFEVEEFYARVDQNLDMLRFMHEAREAANRDFLTRLYNRRYFFSAAETTYANARRGNLLLAVAMFDIDHFKHINDTHGHDAGDQVLVEVARALTGAVRQTDLLARMGGEEFACVLALRSEEEAALACERIRRMVADLQIDCAGKRVPVTISIGGTLDLSDSLADMLKRADQALYASKTAGRNRVTLD